MTKRFGFGRQRARGVCGLFLPEICLVAGLYLLLPKPGPWNTTNFVFSTIASICDRTFVSRIDFSIVLLTYLRLESYVAVHYGVRGGEFRFALEAPALPPYTTAPLSVPPPLVDLGLALRLSL